MGSEWILLHRARLAEVFVERKEYHKGIAATMPDGILGQDFAIQHLQVVSWSLLFTLRLHAHL